MGWGSKIIIFCPGPARSSGGTLAHLHQPPAAASRHFRPTAVTIDAPASARPTSARRGGAPAAAPHRPPPASSAEPPAALPLRPMVSTRPPATPKH